MTTVAAILFWLSTGLLIYTHLGYPATLWVLVKLRRPSAGGDDREDSPGRESPDRRQDPLPGCQPSPSSSPPTTRNR